MATEVLMPKLGLTMTEGTVDQWFKNEGDTVEKGEVVCTISSEKLTHDVEAPEAGVISNLVAVGQEVPCKEPIAVIGAAGEIVQTYKGYLNLPCVLYSMAIYTFFKQHNDDNWIAYLYKWLKPIAGTTLGIYLIHWYLLDLFSRNVTIISPLSLTYRIPGGIVCFCTAAVLTKLLQKIPAVNRLVPK